MANLALLAGRIFNTGLTTRSQIEQALGVPLLAWVSKMAQPYARADGRAVPLALYPMIDPLSHYSRSLQALRSGIATTNPDDPSKVIAITSALPGEGKSTIAMSLAVSAAAAGLKTLFVDADLRHPSASKLLDAGKERGLVELVLGDAITQEVVRFREDAKLWLLPAGGSTPNPPDLLGSDRMKALVAAMRTAFDLIVIDTPPLGPMNDAVFISYLVDKVVVVVRWASTRRKLVQRAMQRIPSHKIAGVVLNQVNAPMAQDRV